MQLFPALAKLFPPFLCVLIATALSSGTPGRAGSLASESPGFAFQDLATGFQEPLVPTAPTSSEEDEDLAQAVKSYREQAADDNFEVLEAFLADHPQSGWRVSLLTNLGLSYYYSGYFSKSINALEEAWREGRSVTDTRKLW